MTAPFALYLMVVFFEYYGFARFVPLVNMLSLSLLTSVGLLVYVWAKGDVKTWLKEKQAILLLVMMFLTMFSFFYAFVREYTLNVLKAQAGYFTFFVVCLYFVADARRSRTLAWLLVLIHSALVLENSGRLFSAVRVGSFAGSYFMGDGNDFAWGLNVVLPLAVFLCLSSRSFVPRCASLVAIFILITGIVGTQSRGAALALAGTCLYFLLMSDHKKLGILMVSGVLVGVLSFAPVTYVDRLETIGTYSEDTSAKGRMEAWGAAINMALDHPLGVGAGNFNSAYGRFYRSDEFFSARWISPHSVYFLVLGEYGFLGLFILVTILFFNFRQNQRSSHCLRQIVGPPIAPLWPTCINASLVAYAVGGAFLGGINYPHLYVLTALTIGTKVMAAEFEKTRDKAKPDGAYNRFERSPSRV